MNGTPNRTLAWHIKHRWLIWRYRYARWRDRSPKVLP